MFTPPAEEKDDVVKAAFYAKLEDVYDMCLPQNAKVILADFNAKVERKLINFTAACNMVVCSIKFQHLGIHKATWMFPDRSTFNQIDHIVIDGMHVSSIIDVRTFRSEISIRTTTLLKSSSDCVLTHRGLHALVHCKSWTLKSCDHKEQLRRSPLNSQISSVVPHLTAAKLLDC